MSAHAAVLTFIDTIAHQQHHPNLPQCTIADRLVEENQRLLPLPTSMPATDLVAPVRIDKTAFARFDTNIYSVPPDHVERTLTLVANDRTVRLLDGATVVAQHSRSFGQRKKKSSIPNIAPRSYGASKARLNPPEEGVS